MRGVQVAPVACLPTVRRPDATTLRVCLLGWCLALLMTPGHFGSVDAERRLQVARSWWTDEPEVAHDDGDFGIPGRDGQRRAWYGPGQSLVMLVPDMVAVSLVAAVPPAARINQTLDDGLVHALVVLSIAPALSAAVAVLGFGLLQALGFGRPAAVGGVLGLLRPHRVCITSRSFRRTHSRSR